MAKKAKKIKVKVRYKHRVPHKPTKVHRDRKKYTRKGKIKSIIAKQLQEDES